MLCMGMACQSNFEGERYFLTKTFSNRFFCYVFFFLTFKIKKVFLRCIDPCKYD